jgi:hypothetical protein
VATQIDRQAHELEGLGEFEDGVRKMKFLNDADPGLEQDGVGDRVNLIPGSGDREMVDADSAEFLFHEPSGAVGGDIRRMMEPFVGAGAFGAPASGEQDKTILEGVCRQTCGEACGVEGPIRLRVAQVGDERKAGPAFERDLIQVWAMSQLVKRGVDMAAGVAGEREEFNAPSGFGMVSYDFRSGRRMRRAIRRIVVERLAEIDEVHSRKDKLAALKTEALWGWCEASSLGLPLLL